MKNILNFIWENKEWLFSGLGLSIFGFLSYKFKKNNSNCKIKQNQKSGKNCTNIQIGGDYKNERK